MTKTVTDYYVICGSDKLGVGEKLRVTQGIRHPNYNSLTNDFDVYVLKLERGFTNYNTATIKPVTLPTANQRFPDNTRVYVSGFGKTSEGGSISQDLRIVELPFVSGPTCWLFYWFRINDRHVCAGRVLIGGVDSCQGKILYFLKKVKNSKKYFR